MGQMRKGKAALWNEIMEAADAVAFANMSSGYSRMQLLHGMIFMEGITYDHVEGTCSFETTVPPIFRQTVLTRHHYTEV